MLFAPARGDSSREDFDIITNELALLQEIVSVVDRHGDVTGYRLITPETVKSWVNYLNDSSAASQSPLYRESSDKKKSELIPAGFAEFWDKYPKTRRYGKPQCLKKWKSRKLENISREIISGLESWLTSEDWQRQHGEFTPAPEVFINQSRWEASPKKKPTQKPAPHPSDDIFTPRAMTAEDRAVMPTREELEAWGDN